MILSAVPLIIFQDPRARVVMKLWPAVKGLCWTVVIGKSHYLCLWNESFRLWIQSTNYTQWHFMWNTNISPGLWPPVNHLKLKIWSLGTENQCKNWLFLSSIIPTSIISSCYPAWEELVSWWVFSIAPLLVVFVVIGVILNSQSIDYRLQPGMLQLEGTAKYNTTKKMLNHTFK